MLFTDLGLERNAPGIERPDTHDLLDRSREANRFLPVMSRVDDFVDKSSGSVEEKEEFPEDSVNGLLDGRGIQIDKPSSTSVDFHKRKRSGGRPRKMFTLEELLECKNYTLEAAAQKLQVSRSTLKRHVMELTNQTWTEFQQSILDSQCLRGKERIQDEDKVPTYMEVYSQGKIRVGLPLATKSGALVECKDCTPEAAAAERLADAMGSDICQDLPNLPPNPSFDISQGVPNLPSNSELEMAADGLEPEEGGFHCDFKEYAMRELKWSRLHICAKLDDGYADSCVFKNNDALWRGIRWVFWSRQDDYLDRPLYHDNFVGSVSDACPGPEVRENIKLALQEMILDPCLNDALVQFWAPTKTLEGRTLLTTQYQPFALGKTCNWDDRQRLCEYRLETCREYNNCFYADAESEEQLGVPGRVFLHKFPEFNLDVQYFYLKEYPQRDLALRCRIKEHWALPVFERSSQTCVGVLEISILYPFLALYGYQKDFLRHLFDKFQEFGLQCISGCKGSEMRDEDEGADEDEDEDEDKNKALAVALKELEMVLESVHKKHKLPLALTWVPCSTCDHLFQGQHVFQAEDVLKDNFFPLAAFKALVKTHHLRKGQVTGRILTFPKLSYCSDVKLFSIAEYPLVAHVRRLELSGCFTMCLHSSWTGNELYLLEFFLPPISKDDDDLLTRLSLILRTVEENSQTFKLACSQEFGGGFAVEVIDFLNGQRSHSLQIIEGTKLLQLGQPDEPSMDAVNSRMNVVSEARNYNLPSFEPLQNENVVTQLDSSDQSSMDPANNEQDVFTAKQNILAVTSSEESKRKTQKIEHSRIGVGITVSLEDILKCSTMNRGAAAKKLGVSFSTLKRVCRGYGIKRWPPHNMKMVHSSRPLPFENQEQTPGLSSDLPSNQGSASVVSIKPAFQDKDLVTIKAKYEKYTIKFRLSLLSTLVELHQEVDKRLLLEAGSYYIEYKDEEDEDELILIACDDDLQECMRHCRLVGKTSIVLQLEPKQTS